MTRNSVRDRRQCFDEHVAEELSSEFAFLLSQS